ncbi:type I restriction enzyme, R subunit [Bartonella choladocola]|uniref:Type I restriction enzyme endonuclease subunit n=1 Tax=Bartonella choladocola TaxID=2750995 RepID=A0A1U9ML96_9HYPH|nr:HsdR family type I site-specific deoxyribonuclease [Bartonella choladocola]AQT48483.1 type I restriction enzyme, R subunit [Bartonella choladocola]
MAVETKPIAETNSFIVLDRYDTIDQTGATYQTEADLENELIKDLSSQGYEYLPKLTSHEALLVNLREQLEKLNSVHFSNSEWQRFLTEYLDRPSDTIIDKTRKIQNNHIYDFTFDNGEIKNIYLIDKKNIFRNQLQVINQFEQEGTFANRYDVTILVNGLPLVQVELKKRGVAIREAFNQIHRYTKESFNKDNSLFKFLQIFVISNGTNTRYFANTTKRDKNSFDFTMNWARSDNTIISDLKDFTATFLSRNTLLNILINYSIFDVENTLLIMRPYQIAATERILWKLKSAHNAKKWHSTEGGGYIWHTTGSGKTLTSFKTALMATELDFIDKVLFVVDRKDLDYQTMKEYRRFSRDSVIGSNNTAGLKYNVENNDNKIIVTTIQKLNNLIKSEDDLSIYNKQVVFIFDEAHRSQFGEAQKNINKKFKQFYQFGFTGTPIFEKNALGAQTTESVFGKLLHSYVITDAIRDEKVLKFKVDYNNVRPLFNKVESEQDIEKLSAAETSDALLHPNRIKEISRYILDNFSIKTHRNVPNGKGFNAMFAVSSVEAAKAYYNCLKALQKDCDHSLKIATIFSFAANGEQDALCEKLPDAKGEIADESFDPSQLQQSDKEFLTAAINDYNEYFKCKFSVDSEGFQNYYRDLSLRVKNRKLIF